jgi:hypothetical protein
MNIFKHILIFLTVSIFLIAMPPHQRGGEKARMLMKWKLTEYLDISEEQGDKFFPRFNSFQKEHKSISKQIGTLFSELEEMIDEGKVKASNIEKIKIKINDLEHEKHQLKMKFLDNNKDILTDEQLAKLLVFEHRFKQKMKNEINPKDKRQEKGKHFNDRGPGRRF